MKVIHIESGLGNQMLSYCEYLAIQKMNPQEECYIETMVYDIPECNEKICQWNGYELEKIFGIKTRNVKDVFPAEKWSSVVAEVKQSEFWNKAWNYPVYITKALNHAGLNLVNVLGDFEKQEEQDSNSQRGLVGELRSWFTNKTKLGNYLRRRITANGPSQEQKKEWQRKLFIKSDEDIFAGQQLKFKYCDTGVELIDKEIRDSFVFPEFKTNKNNEFASFLESCNSVFIHARRGDMLSANGWCYKYGFFCRAVKYIKKLVQDPVFVFFTNTGSIEWCKQNAKVFGLDYSKDKVYFVDWNVGEESYRDMQLMSHCKHGIITNSTFGWWGAYLIQSPNKITISPLAEINTTYHC